MSLTSKSADVSMLLKRLKGGGGAFIFGDVGSLNTGSDDAWCSVCFCGVAISGREGALREGRRRRGEMGSVDEGSIRGEVRRLSPLWRPLW